MEKDAPIFVAGHHTLIGSALVRALHAQGSKRIVGADEHHDFSNRAAVREFFKNYSPQYVFVAGGKSGGIAANQKCPATLMLDNLELATNVIPVAYEFGVQKLLFVSSSCSYPKNAPQPLKVESLLTAPLEPTNEAYALAKIAGMKLCSAYRQEFGANFIVGIPANDFGIGDDFSPEDSHVIGALMRRMHEAKEKSNPEVVVWGTGKAEREFIFADDLADACLFVMREYNGNEPINLGGGETVSIHALAEMIKEVVDYKGKLVFDSSKPNGMPLKSLDSSVLQEMGWRPQTSLRRALELTYQWFVENEVQ